MMTMKILWNFKGAMAMSKWFWLVMGVMAVGVYALVGAKWVPIIWEQNWGDAVVIAFGLIVLSVWVISSCISDFFDNGMRHDV